MQKADCSWQKADGSLLLAECKWLTACRGAASRGARLNKAPHESLIGMVMARAQMRTITVVGMGEVVQVPAT